MKTTRMITMGLFTLCAMGLSQATFAVVKSDNPVEFKYIGKVENNPVFQLILNNDEATEYFINVKDENYNLLYTEKVKANVVNFSRKYRLDVNEDDLNTPGFGVIVEVTSAKTNKTNVYRISSHTTVKEDIIVAKL